MFALEIELTHSDDTLREIGELFRSGYGIDRISRRLSIPPATVRNILQGRTRAAQRVLGGRLLRGRRKGSQLVRWDPHRPEGKQELRSAVSSTEIDLIRIMHAKGFSGAEIAREIDRPKSTVNKLIRRMHACEDRTKNG